MYLINHLPLPINGQYYFAKLIFRVIQVRNVEYGLVGIGRYRLNDLCRVEYYTGTITLELYFSGTIPV